jgi:hypothetical protein
VVGRYSKQDPAGVAIDRIVVELAGRPSEHRRQDRAHQLRHKLIQRLDADIAERLVADYNAGVPTTQLTKKYELGKGSVLRLLSDAAVLDEDDVVATALDPAGASAGAGGAADDPAAAQHRQLVTQHE